MNTDLLRSVVSVACGLQVAYLAIVDDQIVEIQFRGVLADDLKMLASREAVRFAGLGH